MAVVVVPLFACGSTGDETRSEPRTSTAETAGLHAICPASGCAAGQECITAPGPGGSTSTCEIRCAKDAECPSGLRCNLPPVVPDSLVNTCVE